MPELIAARRIAAGLGLAPVLVRRAPTLTLDWDLRQKSRFEAVDSSGRSLAVVLPRGQVVRGGDVLVVDDGSLVAVRAMSQPVLQVRSSGGDAMLLARAAYHLGNRHVALEVGRDALQLEPDHVLAEMLMRMGLEVVALEAPFEPEAGAYGSSHQASGGHAHVHDHDRPGA